MGRSPCCDKVGLKKGPWTPEEDQKLLAYIDLHGHGNWRALPANAGLERCGKSCRLRWTNYLRPDIKRGKFSLQEEQTIIQLHALLGNRWSAIATHLPKRTDNEIKNYWNTHLKKRLTKMGIDPVTHKPKNDTLLSNDGAHTKSAANLSHIAQWERARLEAEARLARQSKLRTGPSGPFQNAGLAQQALWECRTARQGTNSAGGGDRDSSTSSTVSCSAEYGTAVVAGEDAGGSMIEFMGNADEVTKGEETTTTTVEEGDNHWESYGNSGPDLGFGSGLHELGICMDGFTELLLSNSGAGGGGCGGDGEYGEENNKSYWNIILNQVNSCWSSSELF